MGRLNDLIRMSTKLIGLVHLTYQKISLVRHCDSSFSKIYNGYSLFRLQDTTNNIHDNQPKEFCGNRKPWVEVTFSSDVMLFWKHSTTSHRTRLSLHYQVYDRVLVDSYVQRYYRLLHLRLPKQHTRTVEYRYNVSRYQMYNIHRFLLVASPGDVFLFKGTLGIAFYGSFNIFDGFDVYQNLYTSFVRPYSRISIGITSQHFCAHVVLVVDLSSLSRNSTWRLVFLRKRGSPVLITGPAKFRIDNTKINTISNIIYQIKYTGHKFSHMSVKIRKFSGWNDGSCKYGGILLIQHATSTRFKSTNYGPYCNYLTLKHALLLDDGLTFPPEDIFVVVYAFHPLFALDIDIIMKEAMCEGILNPMSMCVHNLKTTNSGQYVNYTSQSYKFICAQWESFHITVILNPSSKCVVIQQIFTETVPVFCFVEVQGIADVDTYTNFLTHTLGSNQTYPYLSTHLIATTFLNVQHEMDIVQSHGRIRLLNMNYVKNNYIDELTYYIKLLIRNVTMVSCTTHNETSHLLWQGRYNDNYLLVTSHMCGIGVYKASRIYVYKFRPIIYSTQRHYTKENIYVAITSKPTEMCRLRAIYNNYVNLFSTGMEYNTINTIRLTAESRYIMLPDTRHYLVYEKNDYCSLFTLQYYIVYVRFFSNLESLPSGGLVIAVSMIQHY